MRCCQARSLAGPSHASRASRADRARGEGRTSQASEASENASSSSPVKIACSYSRNRAKTDNTGARRTAYDAGTRRTADNSAAGPAIHGAATARTHRLLPA